MVMVKSIVFSFDEYLRNGGMTDYVKDDTELVYSKGDLTIAYTKKDGLQGTKGKVIPAEALSLEKISFMSDKRGAIASLLANNNDGAALGFYFQETFKDFKDNLGKAKGLANYAANEPRIGRVQLIRIGKDAAGENRFKRLDLAKGSIRNKVLAAINTDELDHIFDTDGVFED